MITTPEMRLLEDLAGKHGISKAQLMENAGKAAFDILATNFNLDGKRVLVVCYHGNNGGDGFVLARHLQQVCAVTVLFVGSEEKLKDEAKAALEKLDTDDVLTQIRLVDFRSYDFIVDALLGTGARGPLSGVLAEAVMRINDSSGTIISIDIPTGMDPDTGEGTLVVRPHLVITFHDMKPGLKKLRKRVAVVGIGIPQQAIAQLKKQA